MRLPVPRFVALLSGLVLALAAAEAAGREPSGKVSEWSVPTHQVVRDPAVDAKGRVYFAVFRGDRIARFDPRSGKFTEWSLPPGTGPHGVVTTRDGKVFFGGQGSGTIGELDPDTGTVRLIPTPAGAHDIYSVTRDDRDDIWFTLRKSGFVGRLERATGRISTYPVDGEPYGIVAGPRGRIWVTRIAAGSIVVLDARTGERRQVATGAGSRPRRLAIAPDGAVWASLYAEGKVVRIDPVTIAIDRQLELPGGRTAGPYSVAIDAAGRVWVSLFQSDSVAILDPATERFRVVALPARQAGIRNATIDANGRYWYLATALGKLGVID